MSEKKTLPALCHICKQKFPTWDDFANHILKDRLGHRPLLKWANKYKRGKNKRRAQKYERNKKNRDRLPPKTKEQEDALKGTRITLSGKKEKVKVLCLSGKPIHIETIELPIEYVNSETAYRINGLLVVNCATHSRYRKDE